MRHPHYERFKEIGEAFKRHALPPDAEGGIHPHGGLGHKGKMNVQVLRSASDWSMGILTCVASWRGGVDAELWLTSPRPLAASTRS